MNHHVWDMWEAGLSVFPVGSPALCPAGVDPLEYSKQPLVPWKAYQERQPLELEVENWLQKYPDCNWGICTGNKINVVDADSQEAVERIDTREWITYTPYYVQTGKGKHYVYLHNGLDISNSSNPQTKVDVRGKGGYIVAPGSIHGTGVQYTLMGPEGPVDFSEVLEHAPSIKAGDIEALQGKVIVEAVSSGVDEGGRNNNLARNIGQWLNETLDLQIVMGKAIALNDQNNPPLGEAEVRKTVLSMFQTHALKMDNDFVAHYEEAPNDTITPICLDRIKTSPPAKPSVMGRFPIGHTSAVVAMGGAGKSTWLIRQAVQYAYEEGGHTLIISAEDDVDDYANKIHNDIFTRNIDGLIHDVDPGHIANKIAVMNKRGSGAKLIEERMGLKVPSKWAIGLVDTIDPIYTCIIIETTSRFAGGDESNADMEAIVAACDHIARTLGVALVLVHHTGKSQAREGQADLYYGRGGSALGDNTRSMTVLQVMDSTDNWKDTVASHEIDQEMLVEGQYVQVAHVRMSYGPCLPPTVFLKRSGICNGPMMHAVKKLSTEDKAAAEKARLKAREAAVMAAVLKYIKAKDGRVQKRNFLENQYKETSFSRNVVRASVSDMVDNGDLVEVSVKPPKGGQAAVFLAIKGA